LLHFLATILLLEILYTVTFTSPQEPAQLLSRVTAGTGQKWVWPLVTLDPNQMV